MTDTPAIVGVLTPEGLGYALTTILERLRIKSKCAPRCALVEPIIRPGQSSLAWVNNLSCPVLTDPTLPYALKRSTPSA